LPKQTELNVSGNIFFQKKWSSVELCSVPKVLGEYFPEKCTDLGRPAA